MKATRFWGKLDVRIEDVPEPTVTADDEVIIQVAYCGICGTDLHEYLDGPILIPTTPHVLTGDVLPITLGHEFSGRVADVGIAVRRVRIGDRVSVQPIIVCRECEYCQSGRGHLCKSFGTTGIHSATGGLAEYARVKDYQVALLPENVSDEEGAVIEPAAVAANGIERAGLTGGDRVLVTGAGPIGVLSALYADAVGAASVVIAEPNECRAIRLRELDICAVVDPTSASFKDQIQEMTAGQGIDLAIECSGSSAGLATCISASASGGKVVQIGLHTKLAQIDAAQLTIKSLNLLGSFLYDINDWPRIIRMVATDKYRIDKVITSRVGITDVVAEGFDKLVDPRGSELKILVIPK